MSFPIFSILITTFNRPDELRFTLNHIFKSFALDQIEVLVISDGCKRTNEMDKRDLEWVKWFYLEEKIGASAARNVLYKKASGIYLIGLDDDAHIISESPLDKILDLFANNLNAGIIAFKEYKGIDIVIDTEQGPIIKKVHDFIGCGFCVRKDVYLETNGFPLWMDIYGEESCVALEVLNLGYDILFTNTLAVHHRVDKSARAHSGYNLFRFKNVLLNSNKYFLVYYPLTLLPKRLTKLFIHNFFKYAIKDRFYFFGFFLTYLQLFSQLIMVSKYRKPVSIKTINNRSSLQNISY